MYKRKHFPGCVRPARPALCLAAAWEIGVTRSDSTRVRGSNTFCLQNPVSMTKTIPFIVTEVSAMLVETTTFLVLSPAGAKANCCWAGGKEEKSGITVKRISETHVLIYHMSP